MRFAHIVDDNDCQIGPFSWRLAWSSQSSSSGHWLYAPGDGIRGFANQRDAQIALDALAKAGISAEQMEHLADDDPRWLEIDRIACENLPW